MRKSQRAFAAAAVIAAAVAPAVLTTSTASAAEYIPCYEISREPKTIDIVVGSVTLDRVPTGIDWSDCVN